MTYIVMDSCIGVVDHSCIEVCPVHCIYNVGTDPEIEGQPLMVLIDPEGCIDCAACVAECPVEAIVPEKGVPDHMKGFIALNYLMQGRVEDATGPDGEVDPQEDIVELALSLHQELQNAAAA